MSEMLQSSSASTPQRTPWYTSLPFILIMLGLLIVLRLFVFSPFIVSGSSMSPTFESWHYLIIDEISYRLSEPQRGDVIVFRYPKNPRRFFIKRIIGLPGEKVVLNGTTTTIYNSAHPEGLTLKEPYVAPGHERPSDLTVVLGPTEYFVMGDNRAASADSRIWGPLDRRFITGRALLRLFPFTKIGLFPGAVHAAQ